MSDELLELKRRVGIQPYLDMGFINTQKHQPCLFKDHSPKGAQTDRDTNSDFRISLHDGHYRWICTCGEGDIIDCIARKEETDNGEATKRFRKKYENNFSSERPNHDKPKKELTKKGIQTIYNKCTLTEDDLKIIKTYLNFKRKLILIGDTDIKDLGLRINRYRGKTYIVYPIRNIKNEIVSLGRIQLDRDCNKTVKTTLLGALSEDCCYSFNPGKEICCIVEGIEDALTLFCCHEKGRKYTYLVASSAANFKKLSTFLKPFKERKLILDNDASGASVKASECLKKHGVKRLLSTYGEYKDANEALSKGEFQAWVGGLKMVEYENVDQANEQEIDYGFKTISGYQIGHTEYKPVHFVVKGLIPEGLTVLAGKPKLKKSFLMLDAALSVATGEDFLNTFETAKGSVLYFALEDSEKRIKDRIKLLGYDFNELKNINFVFKTPNMDSGFCEGLEKYLNDNKDVKLAIVDTYIKIKSMSRSGQNVYEQDSKIAGRLKEIADKYNIALVIITHLKKGSESDFIDEISGSIGLPGTADSVLHLSGTRLSPKRTLKITGRDIEENTFNLKCKPDNGVKFIVTKQLERLPEKQAIVYKFIKENSGKFTTKEIAESFNMNPETLRTHLRRLKEKELIAQNHEHKFVIILEETKNSSFGEEFIKKSN
jgi:RecA-family ATPase